MDAQHRYLDVYPDVTKNARAAQQLRDKPGNTSRALPWSKLVINESWSWIHLRCRNRDVRNTGRDCIRPSSRSLGTVFPVWCRGGGSVPNPSCLRHGPGVRWQLMIKCHPCSLTITSYCPQDLRLYLDQTLSPVWLGCPKTRSVVTRRNRPGFDAGFSESNSDHQNVSFGSNHSGSLCWSSFPPKARWQTPLYL